MLRPTRQFERGLYWCLEEGRVVRESWLAHGVTYG